jgi:hypothetical protein
VVVDALGAEIGRSEVPLKVLLGVRKETAMPRVPEIIPVTDLRQNAAAALERVRATKQPLVVTQRGRRRPSF